MSQQQLINNVLDKYRIVANPNINEVSLKDIINDNSNNNCNTVNHSCIQLLRLSEIMKYYNERVRSVYNIAIFGVVPSTKLMRVVVPNKSDPSETTAYTSNNYTEGYTIYLTDLEYEHTMIKLVIFDSALKSVIQYKTRIEGMCLLITKPSSIHINSQGMFVIHVDRQNQLTTVGKCSSFQLCGVVKKNSSERCKMPVNASQFTTCRYHSTRQTVVVNSDNNITMEDDARKIHISNIDSTDSYVAIKKRKLLPFPPSDHSNVHGDGRTSVTANIDTSHELSINTSECIVEEQREDLAFDLRHHKEYVRHLLGPGYEHSSDSRDDIINLLDPLELNAMKNIISRSSEQSNSDRTAHITKSSGGRTGSGTVQSYVSALSSATLFKVPTSASSVASIQSYQHGSRCIDSSVTLKKNHVGGCRGTELALFLYRSIYLVWDHNLFHHNALFVLCD